MANLRLGIPGETTGLAGVSPGSAATDAPNMTQVALGASAGKPTAALYETMPRAFGPNIASAGTALGNGTLTLSGIYLPKGTVVSNIAFCSGTIAAGTPTHWWFGLYDSARVQLALTADQTTTAWAASTLQTLAIATIAAGAATSFATTYSGLHYIGVMVAATTPPSILSGLVTGVLTTLPPKMCGSSDVTQTTPPGFPHTATAITASSTPMYGYVG